MSSSEKATKELNLQELPELKRGDIVLVRHKKGIFRYFLRKFFNSYWDHTAMILYPNEPDRNRSYAVIVESIRRGFFSLFPSRGVEIHHLKYYLNNPEKYDVGIRRVPDISRDQRILATHIMLMNVDAPYWPWKHYQIIIGAIFKSLREKLKKFQRFSCSGIIQKAYYDVLPWEEKDKVIFKEGDWSPIELQELVSPADIAKTKNLKWIYNRKVYTNETK